MAILCAAAMLGMTLLIGLPARAEGEDEATTTSEEQPEVQQIMSAATSISISPVSKILQLEPNTIYEDSFKVTNNGGGTMDFEVYASPYSYSYSEADDEYRLGFSNENSYTQITRWITFADANGNYVEKAQFQAQSGESVEIHYKISTPSSIPGGGQYAVLFAHTLSNSTAASGIKTEASPGLVVYGRSTGNTITSSEIRDLTVSQSLSADDEDGTVVKATAKVKNTGNVDFMAQGRMVIQGLFSRTYCEADTRVSVIPETELSVSAVWTKQDSKENENCAGAPYFGIFKATWTVMAAGESQTITQAILIFPIPIIVLTILLLTTIIIWIIMFIRKRKERQSRFAI